MENNIPTLYILELGSFVVKSAKISTVLCPFVQKKQSCIRVAMVHMTQAKWVCVQCWNNSEYFMLKHCVEIMFGN